MGAGTARNGLKVDVKSNAAQVAAFTREFGSQLDSVTTTAMTGVALLGVRQAHDNGFIRGSETPSGKGPYYMQPPPGGDIPSATPKAHDYQQNRDAIEYVRDSAGHILDRRFRSGMGTRYYSHDKVVSRSGGALAALNFEEDPNALPLQDTHHFTGAMDGLEISGMNNQVLIRTTPDSDGQKIATLEKKGAQNGAQAPRYFLRRNLKSVGGRWATQMRKLLGIAKENARRKTR